MISLATSKITKEVKRNVKQALDDNRIAQGRFNKEFECRVANYHGVRHGIGVCNGTMANIVALAALKVKYPDKKEVIVPALTFIAHINSVIANGLKPVFVDVDDDCQIKWEDVAVNKDTLAVMPANLLGVRMRFTCNTPIIEDNCEAYGMPPKGEFATYSFFPSHTITTGEGGMILTDDDELAELARAAMNHGRRPGNILTKFHFDNFGLNGKMSNVLAGIGCAIVDSADNVIKKRRKNVELYNKLTGQNWYAFSPHCYPVFYDSEEERDKTLLRLDENDVEARKLFSCIPHEKSVNAGGSYPNAERIGKTALFVPVHQDLTRKDIEYVAKML